MLDDLTTWLQGLDHLLLLVAAGAGIALESVLLVGVLVPGDLLVLLAASTAPSGWATALVFAVAVAGSVLGEVAGHVLGRRLLPVLEGTRAWRRFGAPWWDDAGALLDRRGGRAVVISRFLPFVHPLVPLAAGAAGVPLRRFAAASLLGSTLWSAAYVGAGTAVGARPHVLGPTIAAVVVAGALVRPVLERLARARLAPDGAAGDGPATVDGERPEVLVGRHGPPGGGDRGR